MATIYRQYMETLLAVDDSVGRVLDTLRRKGVLDSTLIIYMGDNGYAWGEHGMTDKRSAYEESMRIPLLAHCPELIKPGRQPRQMVANIDVAADMPGGGWPGAARIARRPQLFAAPGRPVGSLARQAAL